MGSVVREGSLEEAGCQQCSESGACLDLGERGLEIEPQREQDGARLEHEKGGAKGVLVINIIIQVFRI